MGFGLLGTGTANKSQTSNASEVGQQMNEASGSQALSLSNLNLGSGKNSSSNLTLVSSDYGSIGAALNLTEKNIAMSSAFATDGMSMVSKSLNDSANLAYDGLSTAGNLYQRGLDASANLAYDGLDKAGDLAFRGLDNSANLAYDGLTIGADLAKGVLGDTVNLAFDSVSKGFGFATDVLNIGGVQNLEMLGSVNNFLEVGANFWGENAKLSDSQARYAIDFAAKENSANRAMLTDANQMVGNAYTDANRGLLAFADAGLDRFAVMQNEAVKAINTNSAQAQSASMKALDMVFQSTKSPDERTVQDSTKWIMGGLIAVVALVIIAPMLKGKAS